jgi:hypothetical protein
MACEIMAARKDTSKRARLRLQIGAAEIMGV